SCAALTERIEAQLSREQELAVAPEFFQALSRHLPRISSVTMRPKRGWQHNEMTRFRYDVALQIEAPLNNPTCAAEIWQDWRLNCQDLAAIRADLETAQPPYLGLRHVANARLEAEQRMQQWLSKAAPADAVSELRNRLAEPAGPSLDPEDLWQLAETLP